MEAKGVIRKSLEWRRAREFFYWRVRRRVLEQELVRRIQAADPSLPALDARALLEEWVAGADLEDRAAVTALDAAQMGGRIEALRLEALKREIQRLSSELPEGERAATLA
mmetsp:Transcript_29832/g.94008  ORF Transcript_29832/g.94008 Transcript_29832/m.94008 type:complete len:110 (-) Transcript_29832:93-422(-)